MDGGDGFTWTWVMNLAGTDFLSASLLAKYCGVPSSEFFIMNGNRIRSWLICLILGDASFNSFVDDVDTQRRR